MPYRATVPLKRLAAQRASPLRELRGLGNDAVRHGQKLRAASASGKSAQRIALSLIHISEPTRLALI
eukprot:9807640-Alexandrium_andersonii.AAC.1